MNKVSKLFDKKWFLCTYCTTVSILSILVFGGLYCISHATDKLGFASGALGALIICVIWGMDKRAHEKSLNK